MTQYVEGHETPVKILAFPIEVESLPQFMNGMACLPSGGLAVCDVPIVDSKLAAFPYYPTVLF